MDAEHTPSTKDRIDAAALGLFVRVGVDAATTREIALGAGVSEGALYRHYRSKDALAVALFMGVHRRLSQLVEEAAAGERDISAKAAAIVDAYCRVADENWLYGGSVDTIRTTVAEGRSGQMPAHGGRLSPVQIKLLAAYVLSLTGGSSGSGT